jgi:hypothetical protein
MTTSADQHPGDDAYARFHTLNKRLEDIASDWRQLQEQAGVSD